MSFTPGNNGRLKQKQFFDAIMLEMKAAEDTRGMRPIVRKLLDMAVAGDIQAIREVANRIDGMPVQQVDQNTEVRFFVAELPPVEKSTDAWLQTYSPQKALKAPTNTQ